MTIDRFFTTAITISNPTGSTTTDAEGVPVTGHTTVDTMGALQPYGPNEGEQVLGAELAARARVLWLPLDTPIGHRSTVTARGDRYEVAADPKDWRVGSTNDHLEVLLTQIVAT